MRVEIIDERQTLSEEKADHLRSITAIDEELKQLDASGVTIDAASIIREEGLADADPCVQWSAVLGMSAVRAGSPVPTVFGPLYGRRIRSLFLNVLRMMNQGVRSGPMTVNGTTYRVTINLPELS